MEWVLLQNDKLMEHDSSLVNFMIKTKKYVAQPNLIIKCLSDEKFTEYQKKGVVLNESSN